MPNIYVSRKGCVSISGKGVVRPKKLMRGRACAAMDCGSDSDDPDHVPSRGSISDSQRQNLITHMSKLSISGTRKAGQGMPKYVSI